MQGVLNTKTGDYSYHGHLRKTFNTNKPSLSQLLEEDYKQLASAKSGSQGSATSSTKKWLPGGLQPLLVRDWQLSPGLAIQSGDASNFKYHLGLRKPPQIIKRFSSIDSWITGRAQCEFDPRTAAVSTFAAVRLKLYKYNLTDKQDLKVVVGMDVASDGKDKQLKKQPFFKVEENSWGLRLQNGAWHLVYQL